MHYHHSVLSIRWALYFTLFGNRLQERCSVYHELLRYHTMPTECCEASVCVLFVSLCVVPIAIWSHNVTLCSRISPFLKSQAPLLSSSGFRWLPLLWHWTVSWKYGCQQELFKFSKTQLLLKMQYHYINVQNEHLANGNHNLLVRKCDATKKCKECAVCAYLLHMCGVHAYIHVSIQLAAEHL